MQKISNLVLVIVLTLLGFLMTACSKNSESDTAFLDTDAPNSCVFRGRLQLDTQTKEYLKQYQQDEQPVQASPRLSSQPWDVPVSTPSTIR